jgi:hypothetical protein
MTNASGKAVGALKRTEVFILWTPRSLINQFVKRASTEGDFATEYAIVCHEIKEIFEPAAGAKDGKNLFLQITANQCQITLKSLRLVLIDLVAWMLLAIFVF